MTVAFTVSSPYSYNIKNWDLENPDKFKKLMKIVDEIPKPTKNYPSIFFNGLCYCSQPNGDIIGCHILTGKTIQSLPGLTPICKLVATRNQLYAESIDGEVNVWDKNGELVKTYYV